MRAGPHNLEGTSQVRLNTHHCARIVEFATVIGSGEDCNKVSTCEELVAFFNNLVGTTDQVDLVLLTELLHDVLSEDERYTSLVISPSSDFIWICPE